MNIEGVAVRELGSPHNNEYKDGQPFEEAPDEDYPPSTAQQDAQDQFAEKSMSLKSVLDDDAVDQSVDEDPIGHWEARTPAPQEEVLQVVGGRVASLLDKFTDGRLANETEEVVCGGLVVALTCDEKSNGAGQEPAVAPETAAALDEALHSLAHLRKESDIPNPQAFDEFTIPAPPDGLGLTVSVEHTEWQTGEKEMADTTAVQAVVQMDVTLPEGSLPGHDGPIMRALYTLTKEEGLYCLERSRPLVSGRKTVLPSDTEARLLLQSAQQIEEYHTRPKPELLDKVETGATGRFRLAGAIERDRPEIEPLPAAPITVEAEDRLRAWGMAENDIARLRDLTSSARYDLSIHVVERLAQQPAYLDNGENGKGQITLPDFHDCSALEGDCAQIAVRFGQLLHTSGYMEEVNRSLAEQGKPPLEVALASGSSRTHFNNPQDTHQWVGLIPKGGKMANLVTVDASFQEVSLLAQNGYEIQQIRRNPRIMRLKPARTLALGSPHQSPDMGVIGLSADRALAYSMGFEGDLEIGAEPFVCAIPPAGVQAGLSYCLMAGGAEGSVEFLGGERLTNAQKTEMRDILDQLRRMPIVHNAEKARQARAVHSNVYLR